MSRGGETKTRETPERRCIVTGHTAPPSGLIRFVAGPDGDVVPDIVGRLPGRGMWLTADREAVNTATRKNLFARAARAPVRVAADLPDRVEALLTRRVVELLSMARKAGLAVAGFEKVKTALGNGWATVLLQASDGSVRGMSKLRPPVGEHTHLTCLSGAEIGLAFGREHVIHAALTTGGLSARVVEEATRLSGIRQRTGPDMGNPADVQPVEKSVGDA